MKCYSKSNTFLIIFVISFIMISSSPAKKTNKYRQIIGKNDNLFADKKALKEHKIYKKCDIKTGILNYASKKPKPGEFKIYTLPSYVKLNLDEINFYKTFRPDTLFDSIKLTNIQYISSILEGAHCFDIIVNKVEDNKLQLGPLTICAKNKKKKMKT